MADVLMCWGRPELSDWQWGTSVSGGTLWPPRDRGQSASSLGGVQVPGDVFFQILPETRQMLQGFCLKIWGPVTSLRWTVRSLLAAAVLTRKEARLWEEKRGANIT